MRQYIYLLSILLILFTGCVQDEKDLFKDASNVRMQKTLEECKSILLEAKNGWVFEYYPSTTYYGGFLYGLEFTEDYQVKFSGEGFVTYMVQTYMDDDNLVEETSSYALKKDDGPVLSFDTYNPFIHIFSEPNKDGYGFRGDFEFTIISATSEKIILKGKKGKDYSVLYKSPDNLTTSEYIEEILKNEPLLFPDNILTSWYIIEGKDTLYIDGRDRYFQASYDSNFGEIVTFGAAPTTEGLHFSPGITIKNKTYEYFKLSADKNSLVSEENENIRITSIPLIDFFQKEENWTVNEWVFEPENLGGEFIAAYQAVDEGIHRYNGRQLDSFSLKHLQNRDRDNKVLNFACGTAKGNFDIEAYINNEEEFIINYLGTFDATAKLYSSDTRVPEMNTFIEILDRNSPYTISASESLLNPSRITITSKANPNNWFNVVLQ